LDVFTFFTFLHFLLHFVNLVNYGQQERNSRGMRFVCRWRRKIQCRLWHTNTDAHPASALLGARRPSQTKPCPIVCQRINLMDRPCGSDREGASERASERNRGSKKERRLGLEKNEGKEGKVKATKMALCTLRRCRDASEGGDTEEGLKAG